jgi:hypothetical protein
MVCSFQSTSTRPQRAWSHHPSNGCTRHLSISRTLGYRF